MSKYTPEQYAASAKKHGIPCGPYERKTDFMGHVRIFNSPNGSELATVHYRGDHVEREQDRLGFVVKDVPDLLIALDEKDAEIAMLKEFGSQRIDQAERIGEMTREIGGLRDALESIAEYWNGSANHSAMFDACEHNRRVAEAALKGGAA